VSGGAGNAGVVPAAAAEWLGKTDLPADRKQQLLENAKR
jgi:hypothetical protein